MTSPQTAFGGWSSNNGDNFSAKPGPSVRRESSTQPPPESSSALSRARKGSIAPDERGRRSSEMSRRSDEPVQEEESEEFRSRSLSATPRRPSLAGTRRTSSVSSWRTRTRSVAAVGDAGKRGSIYRQGSLGNLALETEEAEISENLQTKCNIMVQHLYHQLKERLWLSDKATIDQGVVLKMTRDAYTCCPADLAYQQEGFFDAVEGLNVRVAVTISTEVISLFLSNHSATFIPLANGLRLQVLPTMSALPSCHKHQFAAFIADRGCLVVWDDDPRLVLERASKLVNEIVMLIWEDGLENDDLYQDEKKKKPEVSVTEVEKDGASSVDVENGGMTRPIRRRVAWQPLSVCVTCILLFLSTGTGFGQIVEEIYYDRNYTRLLLVLVMPMQLWVSLFFFQSMVCAVLQMVGPISQMKRNTKFYSGEKPKPRPLPPGTQLPHVTIQMPVYKEGLQAVIEPTIASLKVAISTYEMQGGTASVFINDDGMQLMDPQAAQERRDFYDEHNIGWVARPKHNPNPAPHEEVFLRRGKFKKASNMNYAMNVSCRVEEKLLKTERHPDWSDDDETNAYYEALAEVIDEDEGRTWANGNIRIGDYILIIDSDTRVPADCLLDATNEMEESPEVAIIQYSSGVMNVTTSFFESAISNFTRLVYTQIKFAVANGDVAPFVGHNAVLRWTAIQSIGYMCELDNREKFWSEDTVSEDFDIALRLQALGWILRLGAYTGAGFQEGVSLTVYDELARWEKYAYGCSELLFFPIKDWFTKGRVFTPLAKRFIFNKHMPLSAKITILSYVGTYYAIGSAAILTLLNYFLIGWLNGWLDHFYMSSFRIYFAMYIVFTGAGNVSLATLRYRTGEGKLLSCLWDAFKWVPLMTIFLGGISIHVGQAILSHLLGFDMQWGATSKEVDDVSFVDEIPRVLKNFKYTFIMCTLCIIMMIVLGTGIGCIPEMWQIKMVIAVWPLLSIVLGHLLLPLLLNPGLMRFTW